MPTSYKVDFEATPAQIDGLHCLVASGLGVAIPTGYRGELGGGIWAELDARRRGLGVSVTVLPAGFVLVGLTEPLPTGASIDVTRTYQVTCLDPAGTGAVPVPTLDALALEITP